MRAPEAMNLFLRDQLKTERIDVNDQVFEMLLCDFIGSHQFYSRRDAFNQRGTLYGMTSPFTVFALNMDGTGFNVLHSFTGNETAVSLTSSMNRLFGTTLFGSIFALNTDGTGFLVLHTITSSNGFPTVKVQFLGDALYGTAEYEDSSPYGMVFAMNTDGTGFRTLHSFNGIDGQQPKGLLISSGKTLFGTTSDGVSSGNVFAINTDGTGFNVMHSFTQTYSYFTNSDGAVPELPLLVRSNAVIGTSSWGGSSGQATVFAFAPESGTLKTLHAFTEVGADASGRSTNSDGAHPACGLVFSENTLYGATLYGGNWGLGTFFKLHPDGTSFAVLRSFSNDLYDVNSLVGSGDTLYGTANLATEGNAGAVFKLSADGGVLETLHRFGPLGFDPVTSFAIFASYTNSDGGGPSALLVSGDTLYGTTCSGGGSGNGTIFSLKTDGTEFRTLHTFSAGWFNNDDGARPSSLLLINSVLYGAAEHGGLAGNGTVFALKTDGTGFTNLYSFDGPWIFTDIGWLRPTNSDGGYPKGLTLVGNTLYGAASGGGIWGNGTVFALSTNGTGFRVVHSFSDYANSMSSTNSDGAIPLGGVVISGSTLFGATSRGGKSAEGTLFSISLESHSRPQLAVAVSAAAMTLTWPTSEEGFDYSGYTLQSTTSLVSPVWATNSLPPVVVNGQNTVTNPISGTQQFFRLSQ